jgi:NAD(P)-dependent dehydrogenase (short-subunit alcohol dehydrogenase family)
MQTALIVGASRGIGQQFVQRYAAAGWTVHGTVRGALPAATGQITYHNLEVTDDASLDALAATLADVTLDLLVVNAGVIGSRDMAPEKVDRALWLETLAINTVAPLAIAGAFLPSPAGSAASGSTPWGDNISTARRRPA